MACFCSSFKKEKREYSRITRISHKRTVTVMPILSETSPQAQILVPLVASVVFGMMAATLLILLVLPASYAIMEDMGFAKLG